MKVWHIIVFVLLFLTFIEGINTVSWSEHSADCSVDQYFVPKTFITGKGFCANYSSYDVYENCSKILQTNK